MPSRHLDVEAIYKKAEEIRMLQNVPVRDVEILMERLCVVCETSEKSPRSRNTALSNRELLLKSRRRKAQRVYLEVLNTDPHIFLAFLIVITPYLCSQFGASKFLEKHRVQKMSLSNEGYEFLWDSAAQYGVSHSEYFQKLMTSIFTSSPPSTRAGAEGNDFAMTLCDLPAVLIAFGAAVSSAVECSPTHLSDQSNGQYSHLTQCIQIQVPYNGHQDAIISIDIGSALGIADLLFPSASQKIRSVLSATLPLNPDVDRSGTMLDFALLDLRGASVSAMNSIFGADICEGIEQSELRRWERETLLHHTTDCITMEIWRAQPQHGILQLRVGYLAGVNLANKIYYQESPFSRNGFT